MFHRVQVDKKQNINKLYFQRNMVQSIDNVFQVIEYYISKGYKIGSIKQVLEDDVFFHLTFDDGFKEHLEVAYLLKEKYNFIDENATFSINIGNSFTQEYTGMDIIYEIISNNELHKLLQFIEIDAMLIEKSDDKINKIKDIVAVLAPKDLKEISKYFTETHEKLKNVFINSKEVSELSTIFNIASHGVTHRFLPYHQKETLKEILLSKEFLENEINKRINTFCYPEGKNNLNIQAFCEKAGYTFSLSISHEDKNNFCIGRKSI